MKTIDIYYGLSGAMKGSTIESIKKKNKNTEVMESAIKPWKYYQFGIFDGLTEYNDLTYGILHLVRLREFIERVHNRLEEIDKVIVERGITDSMFYYYYNDEFLSGQGRSENRELIKKIVEAENIVFLPDFFKTNKVLLIQEDKDFVKNVVLRDEYRKRTFKNDPNLYFDLQNKYVDFTIKHNNIDEVIHIKNAKEYITGTLGEPWNI